MFYLAYGSNLHPARLRIRTPSARLVAVTGLPGYALCFHKRSNIDGSGKCTLVTSEQSVYAAIYTIEPDELSGLDEIEGVGNGYQRSLINVPRFGACHTYLASSSHIDSSLIPFSWYQDLVVAGCHALRLPATYIESINAVVSKKDQNLARHVHHRLLIQKLQKLAIQVAGASV